MLVNKKILPESSLIAVKHEFTTAENLKIAQTVAYKQQELAKIRQEKNDVLAKYKNMMGLVEDEIGLNLSYLAKGYMMVDTRCIVELDFSREIRIYRNAETKEAVEERPFTYDDKQYKLSFMNGEPAPAEGQDQAQ